MPIYDKYKIIFIHIPKNAGTSINQWLGLSNQDNSIVDQFCLFGQDNNVQLQHLKFNEICNRISDNIINNYHFITVIRNPYDRLISEYCWLKNNQYWSKRIHDQLISIDHFLTYLEYLHNNNKLNNSFIHWHTQVSFLENLDKIDKSRIHYIRFEQLQTDLKKLSKLLKCEYNIIMPNIETLPHLNSNGIKLVLTVSQNKHVDQIIKTIYQDDFNLYQSLKQQDCCYL